jgi:hypothetical protein
VFFLSGVLQYGGKSLVLCKTPGTRIPNPLLIDVNVPNSGHQQMNVGNMGGGGGGGVMLVNPNATINNMGYMMPNMAGMPVMMNGNVMYQQRDEYQQTPPPPQQVHPKRLMIKQRNPAHRSGTHMMRDAGSSSSGGSSSRGTSWNAGEDKEKLYAEAKARIFDGAVSNSPSVSSELNNLNESSTPGTASPVVSGISTSMSTPSQTTPRQTPTPTESQLSAAGTPPPGSGSSNNNTPSHSRQSSQSTDLDVAASIASAPVLEALTTEGQSDSASPHSQATPGSQGSGQQHHQQQYQQQQYGQQYGQQYQQQYGQQQNPSGYPSGQMSGGPQKYYQSNNNNNSGNNKKGNWKPASKYTPRDPDSEKSDPDFARRANSNNYRQHNPNFHQQQQQQQQQQHGTGYRNSPLSGQTSMQMQMQGHGGGGVGMNKQTMAGGYGGVFGGGGVGVVVLCTSSIKLCYKTPPARASSSCWAASSRSRNSSFPRCSSKVCPSSRASRWLTAPTRKPRPRARWPRMCIISLLPV